jgi:bifunctional non-homologous end joining protein LigD
MSRPLQEYRRKRDFGQTTEPVGEGDAAVRGAQPIFVVQKHAARRLHWDFRLEWKGVLLSWAVTRGPSAAPSAKRLAVRTEDHPLEYATFEGVIPKPQYGAGTVMLWDRGTWAPLADVDQGLASGSLKFVLTGARMQGAWALVRMAPRAGDRGENWLLIKEKDQQATAEVEGLVETHLTSIDTGRSMDEIASGAPRRPQPTPRKAKAKPGRSRQTARPRFQPVQLATLQTSVPTGDDWLHEVKVDGYRCLAALGEGGVTLYTRSGLDWTNTFGALQPAFATLACDSALIDGEVVAAGVEVNAFSALQQRLTQGGPLAFVAFDLLQLDGRDMTGAPLITRKTALEGLLADSDPALIYSTHIHGHGAEAWAKVCQAGREGLISKLASAPYRAGRHGSWIKLKAAQRQEFVIGGWQPSSAKGLPFASLLVGSFERGRLVYRGRVGSGFGAREFDLLLPMLRTRTRKTTPFAALPPETKGAQWVRADLVAEIRFTELTTAGHIRHGTFQGLRQDKPAAEVSLDRTDTLPEAQRGSTAAAKAKQGPRLLGVTITNPDRQVYDSPKVTKLDVARYYRDMAPRMLPSLRDRPVSLLRCPDGIAGSCFFQKHLAAGMGAPLKPVAVSEATGDADYITLGAQGGLVAAAQMGTLEFHIWGARNAALDLPDRIVFDLDPDEGLPFAQVRHAATEVRDLLAELGLPSVPMVTGGKGIHVIAPLKPMAEWDTVKLFARTLAVMLSEDAPDRYVATMSKARRTGLIFIDWLRNDRGATAVSPYSLRARPGAKVAVPLTWDELATTLSAGPFDIHGVRDRLSQPCPLQQVSRHAVVLGQRVLSRLERYLAGRGGA